MLQQLQLPLRQVLFFQPRLLLPLLTVSALLRRLLLLPPLKLSFQPQQLLLRRPTPEQFFELLQRSLPAQQFFELLQLRRRPPLPLLLTEPLNRLFLVNRLCLPDHHSQVELPLAQMS